MDKFKERTTKLAAQIKDSSMVLEKLLSEFFPLIIQNDVLVIETIIQAVALIMKEPANNNSFKYQLRASKFMKACTDSWNNFLLTRLKQEIIPIYANILHDYQIQLSQQEISDNTPREARIKMDLFRLILECIFIWSKWLSSDKTTQLIYTELQQKGVVFPKELRFFHEMDILYRDVEVLGNPEKKIQKNHYIFDEEQLFFEHFPCLKQAKILNRKYVSRTVCFIGNKLYQVETTKGVRIQKIIEFPEVCILQEKSEYLELCRNSTKISCKIQGVNLKMEWGEQDQQLKDSLFRLICSRGNEKNRQFALYCQSQAQAVKLRNYIHFIQATTSIPNIKQTILQLANRFKKAIAAHYVNKRVLLGGDVSTQGSSFRIDDCINNQTNTNDIIDIKIDQYLKERNY